MSGDFYKLNLAFFPVFGQQNYMVLLFVDLRKSVSKVNVHSKSDITLVSLIYHTKPKTEKWKKENLKSKTRICSEVSVNSTGNPQKQCAR